MFGGSVSTAGVSFLSLFSFIDRTHCSNIYTHCLLIASRTLWQHPATLPNKLYQPPIAPELFSAPRGSVRNVPSFVSSSSGKQMPARRPSYERFATPRRMPNPLSMMAREILLNTLSRKSVSRREIRNYWKAGTWRKWGTTKPRQDVRFITFLYQS